MFKNIVHVVNGILGPRFSNNKGFLQFLPALISAGATAYAATRKKPNSAMEDFQVPEFQEDPDYRKTQDFLKELGINILEGDIPEYYKGIGETGGAEFENFLNLTKGDIEGAALDTAAATGRGGGAATEIATRNINEMTTKARYADFMRALEGKEWLFGQGKGITEGVRGAGQDQQAAVNNFNLGAAGLEMKKRMYWDEYDAMGRDWEAAKGEAIGGGISSTLGAIAGATQTGTMAGGISGAMGNYDWESILNPAKSSASSSAGLAETKNQVSQRGKIALGGGGFNIKDILSLLN